MQNESCKSHHHHHYYNIIIIMLNLLSVLINAFCILKMYIFTCDSCTGRYCWERILAMGILSVRLSVTTQYGFKARWDRDSGSSPYDSLVSSFLWGNLVPLGEEIPLKRGHQRGVPPLDTVILPLLVHLAWKWLQIDTDLLLIITRTANELSSGTNIDDLEWPWTPKIGVLSDFLLF